MDREAIKGKIIELAKEYLNAAPKREFAYIPPSGKVLGEEELANMIEASLDMWLTCSHR